MSTSKGGKADVVTDSRFAKVHTDPRFSRPVKGKSKVKIDKRFQGLLTDKRFQLPKAPIDQYGRKISKKEGTRKTAAEMKEFYKLAEEDEEDEEEGDGEGAEKKGDHHYVKDKQRGGTKADKDDESEETEDSEEDEEESASKSDESAEDIEEELEEEPAGPKTKKEERIEYLNKLARGEIEDEDELSESSANEDRDGSEEEESGIDMDEDEWAAIEEEFIEEEEDVPLGEETKRIAVLGCDWSRMKAVDLLAVFQSFCPSSGSVDSVAVYPSQYGLEKMAEEEKYGPRDVLKGTPKIGSIEQSADGHSDNSSNSTSDEGDQDSSEAEMSKGEPEENEGGNTSSNEDGDTDEDDNEDPFKLERKSDKQKLLEEELMKARIKRYERQKLKYYFAVVTCDSARTAAVIYDQCDKLEFERSSCRFDLRFIPDDQEFSHAPPREVAHTVPTNYRPPLFASKALQQTNVDLSWEDEDEERASKLTRFNQWREMQDSDFQAFIASASSSDEAEEEEGDERIDEDRNKSKGKKSDKKVKDLRRKYKALLGNSDGESDSALEEPLEEDEDEEGEKEFTFVPDLGKEILEKKKKKDLEKTETPWEKYQREKKEKKKERRRQKKLAAKDGEVETVKREKEKTSSQKEKGKKKGEAGLDNEDEPTKEDLETLMRSDEEEELRRDFDMNAILRRDALANKKLRGKRKKKEEQRQSGAALQEDFTIDLRDDRFGALFGDSDKFAIDPTDSRFKESNAMQQLMKERQRRLKEQRGKKDAVAAKEGHDGSSSANGVSGEQAPPDVSVAQLVASIKRKAVNKGNAKKKSRKA